MSKFPGEVWFLAFCVEIYKTAKGMSGQDAYNYLHRTGAAEYIIDCWDALHATGHLYIIDSIDDCIKNHTTS
ncbi:MAG: DUF3791 domain-containing protein [Desulfobulbaceae bacterium]|jgi:hypothetical protein|nr:DUF3791 domain-containing protein [Desulfobulbaceae bacterium]